MKSGRFGRLVAEARSVWPTVRAGDELLDDLVAALPEEASDQAIRERLQEWFLCRACETGERRAIAQLEREYLKKIDRALARSLGTKTWTEDVRQELRVHLLTRTDRGAARITEYRGQGSLDGWLRVTAARVAYNANRRAAREDLVDDGVFDELASGGRDPELEFMKGRYQREFKEALEAVVATLEAGERNLLRYAYIDKLEIDAIGAIYGVHRTTAGRRLEAARKKLISNLRIELAKTLSLRPTEWTALLLLIESRLDLSLERILRTP